LLIGNSRPPLLQFADCAWITADTSPTLGWAFPPVQKPIQFADRESDLETSGAFTMLSIL
jgi:hypothetical protein